METTPERVQYGYQMLPEILLDPEPPPQSGRLKSTSYSWPATERMVQKESEKLMLLLEGKLRALSRMGLLERLSVYPEMVLDYKNLRSGSQLIDTHIQHNRLWQQAVARDPTAFAEGTRLHDAVMEREAVRMALSAKDPEAFRGALRQIENGDLSGSSAQLESKLRNRERELSTKINGRSLGLQVPGYVRIEEIQPKHWVIEVPVFSDIEEEAFLKEFQRAVEEFWRLDEEGREYRLRITFHRLSPQDLYRGSLSSDVTGNLRPPRRGEPVDLDRHVALFPTEGAVLTTGANSIHVRGAGSILLGPQPVTRRTLAHEFGHVLGFEDSYLRGYRNLGEDGYEIVEVVPDEGDIMTSPGSGRILPKHFEAIHRGIEQ